MSRWALAALALVAMAVLAAPSAAAVALPAPPDTVLVDNELVPDRDLDDCVSSLPQPDCGSEGRSGWRQLAILLALVAGLAFIAWRIVRGAHRSRRPDPIVSHDP